MAAANDDSPIHDGPFRRCECGRQVPAGVAALKRLGPTPLYLSVGYEPIPYEAFDQCGRCGATLSVSIETPLVTGRW